MSSQTNAQLNWLRAAVLGANDGVVSVASIVVGVAAANPDIKVIVTAGVAGMLAGALSMSSGEYVSVSTQRDTEKIQIKRGDRKEGDLTNPWHAALASGTAFLCGAILPLIAVVVPAEEWRIPVTFGAVIVVLAITGVLSAHAGGANKTRATARVVMGGIFAMIITYLVGTAFGGVGM